MRGQPVVPLLIMWCVALCIMVAHYLYSRQRSAEEKAMHEVYNLYCTVAVQWFNSERIYQRANIFSRITLYQHCFFIVCLKKYRIQYSNIDDIFYKKYDWFASCSYVEITLNYPVHGKKKFRIYSRNLPQLIQAFRHESAQHNHGILIMEN